MTVLTEHETLVALLASQALRTQPLLSHEGGFDVSGAVDSAEQIIAEVVHRRGPNAPE